MCIRDGSSGDREYSHWQGHPVILDAFASDYIPEHLMTAEFLEESRSLLTAEGVLVANTFSTSTLYERSLINISEPTRLISNLYDVFCLHNKTATI